MGSFSVTIPRVSDTLRAQLILGNLNNSAVELLRIQNQLSSGRRILAPSEPIWTPFSHRLPWETSSARHQPEALPTMCVAEESDQ